MTVYAFGLEEHTYTGSGTLTSSTYYYSLAGKLIGALDASGTTHPGWRLSPRVSLPAAAASTTRCQLILE